MAQPWTVPQLNQSAKRLDYALVIAGWPTIYSVAASYSLPGTGDLSDAGGSGFESTMRCANRPVIRGARSKGRPEEGSCPGGQLDIAVLDRMSTGRREITELCSRQFYLDDATNFPRSTLGGSIGEAEEDIYVSSIAPFTSPDRIAYVGQECVKYEAAEIVFGSQRLRGCTRGYRLTSATGHVGGARVYPFMPNLYWRNAYVYKGFQDLPLDQWKRAFGGIIGGVARIGPSVTFSILDTSWLAYANGGQMILGPPPLPPISYGITSGGSANGFVSASGAFRAGKVSEDARTDGTGDEYKVEVDDPDSIGNGHYLLKLGENWLGVKGTE